MATHLLCDEPSASRCATPFRLQASAWIEAGNFGPKICATNPPAGIRLRWNSPFSSIPAIERVGRPVRYVLERAGSLPPDTMREFAPSVGHASRAPTPAAMWRPITRTDALTFRARGGDCHGIDALAFKVPASGHAGEVTLIDVNGVAQIVAELSPGDGFHFEWAGLKLVTFSNDLGVDEVLGFDSTGTGDDDIRLDFEPIAEIDALVWDQHALGELTERIENAAGEPFLSIGPDDWDEFCAVGRRIDDAFDRGIDAPADAIGSLALIAATRFEAASLMGLGFIDGEHAPGLALDRIVGAMLASATGEMFAYRVTAELHSLAGDATRVSTNVAFMRASPAPALVQARCNVVPTPVSRAELTNAIRPGPTEQQPDRFADPAMRVTCTGLWELVASLPESAGVATRPIAQDSVITGEPFVDAGTSLTGLNRPPRLVRRNDMIERREHRLDIPYFDSDVGCEAEVLDFWDRRLDSLPARLVQPLIDYAGIAPPLETAICRAPVPPRGGEVDLTLDQTLHWFADAFATYAKAKIAFFMRDPNRTAAEADVEIGPPSPTPAGEWSADIKSNLAQGELDVFVGGTLAIGAFTARIQAIGPVRGGQARCTFDVTTSCAGSDLYRCPAGWLAANLSEDPQAERLWLRLADTIDVLASGAPEKLNLPTALPPLEASATLYFASRIEFRFEGEAYASRLSVPTPAPYLHPAPAPPSACLATGQLATDFYGRVMVRTKASHCHPLDAGYAQRVSVAVGDISATDAFQADRSDGIFGAQASLDGVLFEALRRLGTLAEGTRYTVGVTNLRTVDNRESMPLLHGATLRRVE